MTRISQPLNIQPISRRQHVPKEYLEVAEGMETQFAQHLLTEMRKTVDKNSPSSSAQKIYESMQDLERAKIIAKSDHGLGVKDLVLDQIYPAHRGQAYLNNDTFRPESISSTTGEGNE